MNDTVNFLEAINSGRRFKKSEIHITDNHDITKDFYNDYITADEAMEKMSQYVAHGLMVICNSEYKLEVT
ncbi:MAG: hypothetical protein HRT87_09185 [Legionellales bacterium]|nr:hypothetical protein [Legionellales bacterium]